MIDDEDSNFKELWNQFLAVSRAARIIAVFVFVCWLLVVVTALVVIWRIIAHFW